MSLRFMFRAPRITTLSLIAFALAVRALYFVSIATGPLANQHRWRENDMHFFDRWAREIAGGDWLTDRSLHPMLGWHLDLAARTIEEHPEIASRLPVEGGPEVRAERLWDIWYGGKTFHQEPFYPYLLGATYFLLGPDPRWAMVLQLAAGVGTVLLVRAVARRHFGEVVGALAGFGAALCSPLLYYEGILLRDALIAFAGIALVYLADAALARDTPRVWLLAGLAFGAAVALKSTAALFLAAMACHSCIFWWRARKPLGAALIRCAALGTGVALALAPAVLRNAAVGAPLCSLSSVGAVAFLFANVSDYDPEKGFSVSSEHAPRILAKTDGRALPTVVETLRTHTPGSYVAQVLGKLASTWHWFEKPNNTSFYFYRLEAPVLRFLPITFGVMGPLSLVGLALGLRRWREHVTLYLFIATTLGTMLLFYVLSRFRIHLVPALIPFAALTVARFFGALRGKRFIAAGAIAFAVLVAAAWIWRPLPAWRTPIRSVDYIVPQEVHYGPESKAALDGGDPARAARILERSLRFQPPDVLELGPGTRAMDAQSAGLGRYYATIHDRYALALERSGDPRGARKAAARARELREACGP